MPIKSVTFSTWDDLASQYGEFVHEQKILGPALVKIFSSEDVREKKVADVGSGTGVYSKILAVQFACEVFGFDISSKMVEAAQKTTQNEKIHFQVAGAAKLPLCDQSVDVVLMSTLISNLRRKADLDAVFQEAKRVLKTDGLLIVTTPHPCFETLSFPKRRARTFPKDFNYFSEGAEYSLELFKEDGTSVKVLNYHWTLETQLQSITGAGFSVGKILEPEPVEILGDESLYPVYMVLIAKRNI